MMAKLPRPVVQWRPYEGDVVCDRNGVIGRVVIEPMPEGITVEPFPQVVCVCPLCGYSVLTRPRSWVRCRSYACEMGTETWLWVD